MDVFERIVYETFDVPDILDEGNQRLAAAAGLLRAAEETGGMKRHAQGIQSRPVLYQDLAAVVVDAIVEALRAHELDQLLGRFHMEYVGIEDSRDEAVRVIVERAAERQKTPGNTPIDVLAGVGLDSLTAWVSAHPNALRARTSITPPASDS